ncbi:MAG: hypothetical protein R3E10_09765 [Gemmatimonadota bacterium]
MEALPAGSPCVVLDVDVRDGLVELVLENVGERPALEVRVQLQPTVRALGGEVDLDRLPLFERLGVLRPQGCHRVFVDRLAALLEQGPERFRAAVSCKDERGRPWSWTYEHDLGAFRGLPGLLRSE